MYPILSYFRKENPICFPCISGEFEMNALFPQKSGLMTSLAQQIPDLRALPPIVVAGGVSLLASILTEIMSNGVLTAILTPILANVVSELDVFYVDFLCYFPWSSIWIATLDEKYFQRLIFVILFEKPQLYVRFLGGRNGRESIVFYAVRHDIRAVRLHGSDFLLSHCDHQSRRQRDTEGNGQSRTRTKNCLHHSIDSEPGDSWRMGLRLEDTSGLGGGPLKCAEGLLAAQFYWSSQCY